MDACEEVEQRACTMPSDMQYNEAVCSADSPKQISEEALDARLGRVSQFSTEAS